MPVALFEEVSFSYDGTPILTDVSLALEEGEFVGLIGPNGGGKTTLLKLMMGLIKPKAGTVQTNVPTGRIGYVPQALPFDRRFPISVMELVLAGTLAKSPIFGRYPEESRILAREALARVEMSHLASAPFGTLSGGQMQRALIARALASDPLLLLLDEPTANIDAQAEGVLHALLNSLKGKITIAMVTHDLPTAVHEVERVLCVNKHVTTLAPEKVCEHFAVGLYHPPLIPEEKR